MGVRKIIFGIFVQILVKLIFKKCLFGELVVTFDEIIEVMSKSYDEPKTLTRKSNPAISVFY